MSINNTPRYFMNKTISMHSLMKIVHNIPVKKRRMDFEQIYLTSRSLSFDVFHI